MIKNHQKTVSITLSSVQSLARVENLKKTDYRVILFLMGHLDSLNLKSLDKKNIAAELDLDKDDIKKSLQNLENAGVVFHGSSQHVKDGYKFDL
jgi:predicted transcriptional regulator